MPAGDGTGPMGMGPMTGRAAGYCAGYPVPGFMNRFGGGFGRAGVGFAVPGGYGAYAGPMAGPYPYAGYGAFGGRGLGMGWGRGFGRGFGMGWGRGFGRGLGMGWGRGFGRGRGRGWAW